MTGWSATCINAGGAPWGRSLPAGRAFGHVALLVLLPPAQPVSTVVAGSRACEPVQGAFHRTPLQDNVELFAEYRYTFLEIEDMDYNYGVLKVGANYLF